MEPLRRTWHVQQGVGCHDDGWLATAVGEACRSTNQGYGWHELAECDRILSVSRKLNRCWLMVVPSIPTITLTNPHHALIPF